MTNKTFFKSITGFIVMLSISAVFCIVYAVTFSFGKNLNGVDTYSFNFKDELVVSGRVVSYNDTASLILGNNITFKPVSPIDFKGNEILNINKKVNLKGLETLKNKTLIINIKLKNEFSTTKAFSIKVINMEGENDLTGITMFKVYNYNEAEVDRTFSDAIRLNSSFSLGELSRMKKVKL